MFFSSSQRRFPSVASSIILLSKKVNFRVTLHVLLDVYKYLSLMFLKRFF